MDKVSRWTKDWSQSVVTEMCWHYCLMFTVVENAGASQCHSLPALHMQIALHQFWCRIWLAFEGGKKKKRKKSLYTWQAIDCKSEMFLSLLVLLLLFKNTESANPWIKRMYIKHYDLCRYFYLNLLIRLVADWFLTAFLCRFYVRVMCLLRQASYCLWFLSK